MLDWKFYFQRRRLTLKVFLKGVTTIEDAIEKFMRRNLTVPDLSILHQFYGSTEEKPNVPVQENNSKTDIASSEPKKDDSKPVEETLKKYDDIVIIDTNETIDEH